MSAALSRLRHLLKDELFIRRSDGMHPTRRAIELAVPLRQALQQIQAALEQETFVPAEAKRTFKLATNDFAASVLLPGLGARINAEAPRAYLVTEYPGGSGSRNWVSWRSPLIRILSMLAVGCQRTRLVEANAGGSHFALLQIPV